MEETKAKAIVIGSKDYKDTAKLLTLFSLEKGVFYAVIKGVKSPNAKLKAVKEVFCFADFILSGKSDIQTIISAEIIDSFYDITNDYQRFCAGAEIFKIIPKYAPKDYASSQLFLLVLKCLKILAYEPNVNEQIVLAKFYVELLSANGYKLNLDKCAECGLGFARDRYLCLSSGAVKCSACKDEDSVLLTPLAHATLKMLSNVEIERLSSIKPNKTGLDETVKILKNIL